MKRKSDNNRRIIVILHNIRSLHNVGSIFRTADALGVNKIFLTGYTPAPIDRFGRIVMEISKTALGAEKNIPWEKVVSISKLLKQLKKGKFHIIAIEQWSKSRDYKKIKLMGDSAFVFGNEVSGLPNSVLKTVDVVAEIPIRGKLVRNRLKKDLGKESLNVSVSFGVALFKILGV